MSDIYGLPLDDLDEDAIPTDALVIVKCLDGDGDMRVVVEHTEGLTDWEAVGLLTCVLDAQRAEVAATFEYGDDDE